jgi:hypothetical protein
MTTSALEIVRVCDDCGDQGGEILEPETGFLGLTVTIISGSDILVRLFDPGADDPHRVLECYHVDWSSHENRHEGESLFLLLILHPKMPCSRDSQMLTGRMKDSQIPVITQDLKDISLYMLSWFLSGEEITAPGIMSPG